MRQAQKKKDKDKVAIVLVLSFCVIALTSIFTLKSNIDKINDNEDKSGMPVSEETKSEEQQESAEDPGSDTSAEASSEIPAVDSLDNAKTAGDYLHPVSSQDAQVTNPYSMDKLIYSVTLDQYMTHCGVDIEAPADSQVVAVAEGTVTAIYSDDRYGSSIEITHPGDVITIYSNLAESSEPDSLSLWSRLICILKCWWAEPMWIHQNISIFDYFSPMPPAYAKCP